MALKRQKLDKYSQNYLKMDVAGVFIAYAAINNVAKFIQAVE